MVPAHVIGEAVKAIAKTKTITLHSPLQTDPADDGVYVEGYVHVSDEEIEDYLIANYEPYRLRKREELYV